MLTQRLVRSGGLAALVGGGLLVVVEVVEGVIFPSTPKGPELASGAWILFNVLDILLLALVSLGLVGIYERQAGQAGALGLIGFLAFFLGVAMMLGVVWAGAFVFPWFAAEGPAGLPQGEPSGVLALGFLLTIVLLGLGGLLFGLASLRAEVLPRGAAGLLMPGAVLASAFEILDIPFSAVVLGAALGWMGYAVWSGSTDAAAASRSAIESSSAA